VRILITGAGGQLGRALQRVFFDEDVLPLSHAELDVTASFDPDRLDDLSADVVIHAAALTDTALCEKQPELATIVNEIGSENVAVAADYLDAKLIVVSTNEVFGHGSTEPYVEACGTQPLNEYGRSKAQAEDAVLHEHRRVKSAIVRTSWLYGEGRNNFPAKVIAAARAGKPLRFVTDEVATPTYVDDLAVAIRQLIEREAPAGIYHLTNEGEASRYEWACEILRLAGMSDVPVEPITTEQLYASGYDGPRKPPYSVLANTRARALGITMRDWREALADYFATYRVAAEA
jgi:dTDP-4-dehydrorhamnose reductase